MNTGRRRLAIHLTPAAERAVRGGHPWVYAQGVRSIRHAGRAGDLAVLFDGKDRFLAIGLYDPTSPIRVRVLHRGNPLRIDGAWLLGRLTAARDKRQSLQTAETTALRLVHGENDGLPGLVVDRYEDSLVIKIYTSAWLPHLPAVVSCLEELVAPGTVVLRVSRNTRDAAVEAGLGDGHTLLGQAASGPVLFRENGLRFEADLLHGQKTGFFLDQRDNRARLERISAGRTVLNVFSYTGGFSLYAARGGATSVVSLDASGPALEAAERNFGHNQDCRPVAAAAHTTLQGDAFETLPALRDRGDRFDVVVLDPPAFVKSQQELDRGMRSYGRILRLGLQLLHRRGMLVAASCSSRVTPDAFRELVQDSAEASGRRLSIQDLTGHPPDHPIGFPEGAYLKCVFARATT